MKCGATPANNRQKLQDPQIGLENPISAFHPSFETNSDLKKIVACHWLSLKLGVVAPSISF
jgi:hypothetical protein